MKSAADTSHGLGRKKPGKQDRDCDHDCGVSLIELVVAMALFALVAVMGTQALTGMMRMRGGLQGRAEQAAVLDRSLSLLRADLRALVPMLFYPPERQPPQSALRFRNGLLGLSVGGQPALLATAVTVPQPLGIRRVEWQVQGDVLQRRSWPVLTPAQSSSRSPAQVVMTGVTGIRLRSYWADLGWVTGAETTGFSSASSTGVALDGDSSAAAIEVYSSTLPLAVELTLETHNLGQITLVETLK